MGSVARQHKKPGRLENQSDGGTFHNKAPCTCSPSIVLGSCRQEAYLFSFQGLSRGRGIVLGDAEATTLQQGITTWPFGGHHTFVTHHHTSPHTMHTLMHWQRETQRAATTTQYNPCTPPFLFGGILLQCPDCLQNEGECDKWRASGSIRYGHLDSTLHSLV